MMEAGDAAERRYAAGERARADLACVHGLGAGYNRGLEATASVTVFCAGTGSPKIRRPRCLLPSRTIHDPERKFHLERDDAPETVSWSGASGQRPIMWLIFVKDSHEASNRLALLKLDIIYGAPSF